MITQTDAGRIHRLGAPKQRIQVNGNIKFDALHMQYPDDVVHSFKKMFALDERSLVWVGGKRSGG